MKKKTALLLRDIACPCIFSVLVVTLSYMGFYRLGFGSDTILHFRFPLANIVAKFSYGRYLEYVVEYALYLLGIIVPVHYRLFFGFFLLATGVSAFLVQEVLLPWYRKKHPDASQVETYFIRFVICLPFASTLFGEFMYFPECFLYSTGFFFMAIALHCLAKKQYVRTAVFLIAACLIYQTNVILFAIYGTLLLVLEADLVLSGKLFGRVMALIALSLGTGFADFKMTQLLFLLGIHTDVPKPVETREMAQYLKNFFDILIAFFRDGFSLLPVPWLNLLLALACLAVGLAIFGRKGQGSRAATFVLLFLAVFLLAMVLPLVQSALPRMSFPLYTAISAAAFTVLCYGDMNRLKWLACLILLGAYLQVFACQQMAVNHYISNTKDLEYAGAVLDKIDRYEAETGIKVTKVVSDIDPVFYHYYDGIYYTCGSINERTSGLSSYCLLEYVQKQRSGSEEPRFEVVFIDQQAFWDLFDNKDWDQFDPDEQVKIEGDTVYWCVF